MKFKDKYAINPEFEELFSFKSKEEELEHEAKLLMFRFLSELEKLNGDRPIKKKDLAIALGTSPSYITQLFRGDKLINLASLAKIEKAYNITFEITASQNEHSENADLDKSDLSGEFDMKENIQHKKKKVKV